MRGAVRGLWFPVTLLLAACAAGSAGAPREPVAAVAPPLPALSAAPASLRFEASGNTWPTAQAVAVEASGPGVLPPVAAAVTLDSGRGWLRVTQTGAGNAQRLTVQPTPSNLPPGTYRGEVVLSAPGWRPATVPVTLTLLAASGARCPPGSTLAWRGGGGGGAAEPADFASTFLTRYCTGCHHAAKAGDARNGAPPTMNFDTHEAARRAPYTLDLAAAAGPAGSRAFMPPEPPEPTLAERTWLGQWIACGQP